MLRSADSHAVLAFDAPGFALRQSMHSSGFFGTPYDAEFFCRFSFFLNSVVYLPKPGSNLIMLTCQPHNNSYQFLTVHKFFGVPQPLGESPEVRHNVGRGGGVISERIILSGLPPLTCYGLALTLFGLSPFRIPRSALPSPRVSVSERYAILFITRSTNRKLPSTF